MDKTAPTPEKPANIPPPPPKDQQTQEVGIVTAINNFLMHLDGFPTIRVNDVIQSDSGARAWISALHPDHVDAFLLGDTEVKPGELFRRQDKPLMVDFNDSLIGRTINPLGVVIDGKGSISNSATVPNFQPLDKKAPGIKEREFISKQLETGIMVVDLLLPIGKGQRQLIVGDARSGKTSFLTDMIINQKGKDVMCIYAAIGKPIAEVRGLIDTLEINNALPFTTIIASPATDPPALIYLAPQTAFSLAEYFESKGKDVLMILDDMGIHAKIYREMSLLAEKLPGRESYPGDVFYQHSHLVERAGNFKVDPKKSALKNDQGGGSITALPVVEINLNDFTTLIPTNLMAMTDGHLMFKAALFNQGVRPSVDISLSVTRVGLQTQTLIQKFLSQKVKATLTRADELASLSSFSNELTVETQAIHKQGAMIKELLKQHALSFIPKQVQVVLMGLVFTPFLNQKEPAFLVANKEKLINAFINNKTLADLATTLINTKEEKEFFEILDKAIPQIEQITKET